MAIITTSDFTRLEEGRITDCKYFLITGAVIEKRLFKASMTPVRDDLTQEVSFWVADIPMAIDNPLLLRACHDSAILYLKQLNPNAEFSIVDLNE
jgi:hypothetical protein